MPLMSMRTYAKHRGVTVQTISRAVKSLRISTVQDHRGQRAIDPAVADVEWIANANPLRLPDSNNTESKSAAIPLGGALVEKAQAREPERKRVEKSPAPGMDADKEDALTFNAAKAMTEKFKAKMARLEFERESGMMVSAEDVEARWTGLATITRSKVMGIQTKVRQHCPNVSVEDLVMIEKICREALEELADGATD